MSDVATTKMSSKGQVVIPEAIRERLSNPLQPLIERDYLERLLRSR